jgi:hypothetical protein
MFLECLKGETREREKFEKMGILRGAFHASLIVYMPLKQ